MKIQCEREKLLHAFQTAASVAPSRSPKPILQNLKLEVHDGQRHPDGHRPGGRHPHRGARASRRRAGQRRAADRPLPFHPAREHRRSARRRQRRPEDPGLRPAERVPVALGEPRRVPGGVRVSTRPATTSCPRGSSARSSAARSLPPTPESTRYALGGVLLELTADHITAVATDGRRLARQEGPAKIGRRAAGRRPHDDRAHAGDAACSTARWATARRSCNSPPARTTCSSRAGGSVMYSRLVEGRFPKWRDVFPRRENTQRIEVDRRAVLLGGPPGGHRHQRRAPRRRFHLRPGQGRAGRPRGRVRRIARRVADRLRRAGDRHHARSALPERLPPRAQSRGHAAAGTARRRERRGLLHRRRLRLRDHAAGTGPEVIRCIRHTPCAASKFTEWPIQYARSRTHRRHPLAAHGPAGLRAGAERRRRTSRPGTRPPGRWPRSTAASAS